MKEIMGIIDCHYQALQQQFWNILNAMQLVHSTKMLIPKLRDDDRQDLLKDLISFCNITYIACHGYSHHKKNHITIKHHFRHFIINAPNHPYLKNLSTMLELCESLTRTRNYNRKIFFSNEIIKTKLCNRMKDEFNMIIYIEKEIPKNFSFDSIIYEFKHLKEHRVVL
ncbi:hypothetical protein CR513_12247, partial [Mucuna pruriens]